MTASVLYVATWPEESILAYFWDSVRAGTDRTALLRQLAPVVVKRPPEWSSADVRLEHEQGKHPRQPDRCFACRTGDRRLYWHHIIAIQHGGSNDDHNQVAICLRCHADVHPWLEPNDPNQRRRRPHDFHSISEIMDGACAESNPALIKKREREQKFADQKAAKR